MKLDNFNKIIEETPQEAHDKVAEWMDQQDKIAKTEELMNNILAEVPEETKRYIDISMNLTNANDLLKEVYQ